MTFLDELSATLAKATPGPWLACVYDPMERPHVYVPSEQHHRDWDMPRTKEDAEAIVAAVNSLPWLIARLQEAEAYVAVLTGRRSFFEHGMSKTTAKEWLAAFERGPEEGA